MSDEYGHRLKGFTLRLEEELGQKIKEASEMNGLSKSDEMRTRLTKSFDDEKGPSKEFKELKDSVDELHKKIDFIIEKIDQL